MRSENLLLLVFFLIGLIWNYSLSADTTDEALGTIMIYYIKIVILRDNLCNITYLFTCAATLSAVRLLGYGRSYKWDHGENHQRWGYEYYRYHRCHHDDGYYHHPSDYKHRCDGQNIRREKKTCKLHGHRADAQILFSKKEIAQKDP